MGASCQRELLKLAPRGTRCSCGQPAWAFCAWCSAPTCTDHGLPASGGPAETGWSCAPGRDCEVWV